MMIIGYMTIFVGAFLIFSFAVSSVCANYSKTRRFIEGLFALVSTAFLFGQLIFVPAADCNKITYASSWFDFTIKKSQGSCEYGAGSLTLITALIPFVLGILLGVLLENRKKTTDGKS